MITPWSDPSLRGRMVVAGILAVTAVVLLVVVIAGKGSEDDPRGAITDAHGEEKAIAAVFDTLFAQYRVDPAAVRTWHAGSARQKLARMEQRVTVPAAFPTLEFNHRLNALLEKVGAHVTATERTGDNVVTMHVVRRGIIVRSVTFELRRHEETSTY
jgi:hypothetical protein